MSQAHSHSNIPHLATAMTGPLHELEHHLIDHQTTIETWLRKQWALTPAPLTSSVDLRNAGFKLAPVDTNLFPAGFNNLADDVMPLCIQAAQASLEKHYPGCERILLIAESHSRNIHYLESLARLQTILTKAGFVVAIGSLMPELTKPLTVTLPNGSPVTISPIQRHGDKVSIDQFSPCIIILNNDLSEGIPELLENLQQPITPPLRLGWANRLKSIHFQHYSQIAKEFAEILNIDPWFISPLNRNCGEINFKTRAGEDCLIHHVEELLQQISTYYQQYNIDKQPFVIVKADAGTYGMGIMSVNHIDQVHNLNRKQRQKMMTAKGKQEVSKILIQEGVYSFETWGEAQSIAEPVVYMLGQHVVGGFYRVHKDRGPQDNLNAPGMQFEPLAFVESCNNPDSGLSPDESPNRFYAYGVIARLALLAAARELKEVQA